MIHEKIIVTNKLGLHGRPANRFVKEANKFASAVTVCKGDKEISGKSIVKLLTAHIQCGDEITISCDGVDEGEALAHMIGFIKSGVGDQE